MAWSKARRSVPDVLRHPSDMSWDTCPGLVSPTSLLDGGQLVVRHRCGDRLQVDGELEVVGDETRVGIDTEIASLQAAGSGGVDAFDAVRVLDWTGGISHEIDGTSDSVEGQPHGHQVGR